MAKVFLVEEPKNVSPAPAEDWGEIEYVFQAGTRRPSVFDCQKFGNLFLDMIKEKQFDPEKDYFCLTGSLLPVCVGLVALLSAYGKVNILAFVSTEGKYVKRTWRITHENAPA